VLKEDLLKPLFLGGLAAKIILALFLAPAPQIDWFIPFMDAFWKHPSITPWDYVFQNSAAFPYGITMFVTLLPCTFADFLLAQLFGGGHLSGHGITFTLILADVWLYLLLCLLLPGKYDKILRAYWLSPISLVGIYWVGQLDTIPVCFLFSALLALQQRKAGLSGFLLAAACSAKLSMAAVLPFFLIYLFLTPRLRNVGKDFLLGLTGGMLVLLIAPLFSGGYRMMVLGTPEMLRVFDLHIQMGNLSLYLTPVIYGLGLYFAWRIRRMTFDLFYTILGLSFFLLVFSTPAPPGWYLWLVPFITIFQVNAANARHWRLLFLFSACVSLAQILFWPGAAIPLLGISLHSFFPDITRAMPVQLHSIWISGLFFLGAVVYLSMLRENVYRSKAYITWRRPMGIAVAGDSGTGKDRLARTLAGMFGQESIAHISGDDYHLWDRFGVMWQSFTHLHPGANNLQQFAKDVTDMFCNKSIACREYDHATGRFNPPLMRHGNDVIIVSGLHSLMNKSLRDKYDISIYLDMDETLRRWFKCRRDCLERGHELEKVLASIERRMSDAEQFIHPQRDHADIIFSLYPVTQLHMGTFDAGSLQLGLHAELRGAHFSSMLVRHLTGLCGMRVDVRFTEDLDTITLTIEGELVREDTAFIASRLFPDILELLALQPRWAGGMDGVMQLIVLSYFTDKLESKQL
jgi:uridine kinase